MLAREVVEHALEPLVYRPGPHQTADQSQWTLIKSYEILDLKVADIACGSGAFLVAAAEYLAERLVEAWHGEGVAVGSAHELDVRAKRQVVANCLYGADINGMAVEMCKLSLWLVSLDPNLPFSFVDDKVLHGNSLLGITDVRQLEALHIDPSQVKTFQAGQARSHYSAGTLFGEGSEALGADVLDIRGVIRRAVDLRHRLASEIDELDPQRSAAAKRRLWRDYQQLTATLAKVADGVIAAGLKLGGKPGRALNESYDNLRIAIDRAHAEGSSNDSTMLDGIIKAGLTPTVETDYHGWKPLHWALAVPDVMERGGFSAIIGNPPFLGGKKISGAMGSNVREWFVNSLADGVTGNADLVGYFFLRVEALLCARGTLGLIATNTIAQGDTREVGLERMAANGLTLTRAVQSRAWPAESASLEYSAVWGSYGPVSEETELNCDGNRVRRITPLLEAGGRVSGSPLPLASNAGIAQQGCIVLGQGFVLEPDEAHQWIDEDPRNAEVLFPYIGGEDINSTLDGLGTRWVIDFYPRSEREASNYKKPFARVTGAVKSERLRSKSKAFREASWWLFLRPRPSLRKAMAGLDRVIVLAQVSKTVMPLLVPAGQVFSHKAIVFATDSLATLSVLSSNMHYVWTAKYSATMRSDTSYSPTDVFVTLPLPVPTEAVEKLGETLDAERREIMLGRDLGLTKLYNLVNDPEVTNDAEVTRLREIHVELDKAVMSAYGWDDVQLEHGFHTYRQMQRWTVSPAARVEILDRLLEENHRRAALHGDVPTRSPVASMEGE